MFDFQLRLAALLAALQNRLSAEALVVYEGPAQAMNDWGPHYSRTSRFVHVIIGSSILIAEVSPQTSALIGLGARVWVKVEQRPGRTPYITELYLPQEQPQQTRHWQQQQSPVAAPAAKDYYGALGVERDAPIDEINRAFRRLAKTCHPDLFPGDAQKEKQFKEINEAHEILSDVDKRAEYDLTLPV